MHMLQNERFWDDPSSLTHEGTRRDFKYIFKLEDLTVLKRSPDRLNVQIGQDQLRLIMKHNLFYGGYGHIGWVT